MITKEKVTADKKQKRTTMNGFEATQKPKSKFTLWREQNPEGLDGVIINMRAVLR